MRNRAEIRGRRLIGYGEERNGILGDSGAKVREMLRGKSGEWVDQEG
jgi:hypothetical protein